ncbi:MAG: hypothetical protein ACOYIK_06365 [Coriobacteriales bacterium]
MERSKHYGELQKLIDELYSKKKLIDVNELTLYAQILDLHPDLQEICNLVPYGIYDRQSLCDQMNSAITGHGWGGVYGTVC